MCGILGLRDDKIDADRVKLAVELMKHRGPDHQALIQSRKGGNNYLGHTRLSILDPSSAANQPMTTQSGKCSIIFNGEIYNFKSIREKLQTESGLVLKTESDTELLVEAFEFWGPDFVERLNGMFAFGIFEHSTGRHFLYRDRVGIKPLYYFENGESLAYASELKAIRFLYPDLSIDKLAIYKFLHLGYIPHPHSIYQEVKTFPVGSYGIYEAGKLTIRSYWEARKYFEREPATIKDPIPEIKKIIERSVEYRLLSDVPVGTFLSGGIDSSLVTKLANDIYGAPLPAFHVRFENAVHDESALARQVAEASNAEYHEIMVTEEEALTHLWDAIDGFDEPFNDQSAIPTSLISRKASKSVKVCLSGDGGDELFLGYGMYNWAMRLNGPMSTLSPMIHKFLKVMPGERNKRASWLFDDNSGNRFSHIFSQEQYLYSQSELHKHFQFDVGVNFDAVAFNKSRTAAENQAFFDFQYYLPDDLLTKVDRASMMHSLEVRVPLLDHELTEYMIGLHNSHKWKKGDLKYLLRNVLKDYLPSYHNNKKWGFSPPMVRWLRTQFKSQVDKYLAEDIIERLAIVNSDYVKKLLFLYYVKGEDRWYNRIWSLMILHRWLVKNT